MNFFEMLIMSRKMEFKESGEVTIYNQDIVVLPDALMVEYMLQIDNEPEWKRNIYSAAKDAMLEHKENFATAYKASDGQDWICNTINLLGQGKIRYEDPATGLTGTVLLENSPTARDLKGIVKGQTDHVLRGIIAGLTSAVLGKDMDVIETECVATGSAACKLIVGSEEDLKSKFAGLYPQQI